MIKRLREHISFKGSITSVKFIPGYEGNFVDFPEELDVRLKEVLKRKGIERLYSHQLETWNLIRDGENVVIQTPTSSGKTLCYNLPVLDSILKSPDARAVYLFPTKALSRDQVAELYEMIGLIGEDIVAGTFDGDTPQSQRKKIRQSARIVVTNPDMLHQGIIPHHTKWVSLFSGLKYVIVDEIHVYRGVFGSHFTNIMRRLKRVARFYGS
ncbi:MAG: ATP-dependent helicase, partial [Candidatus Neomarinimicrobiota bacterium]